MSRNMTVQDMDAFVNGVVGKLCKKLEEIGSIMNSPDTSPQSKVVMGAARGAISEVAKAMKTWDEVMKSRMSKDDESSLSHAPAQSVCQCRTPKAEKPKLELTPAQIEAKGRRDSKGHFAPKQKPVTGGGDAGKTEGNA